ncbi:porin [Motiliproteus coralliicola]|uniref:Porin n=1 Tax=Motiliproteus coralliicola TaxID=2283196 RepID=A0A369WFX7_9GAMM|nr:porin [Motiliproteus coralliicola]RDE19594.1 porin [Motiliproteus coralliicola]
MKKSLIALAVAGALTAPMIAQADATLYGIAQFRGVAEDDKSFNSKMAKTRLGVKGTVDNDIEGLTTGFQFEWEFDGNGSATSATNSSSVAMRKSNVYMKGDFGILSLGRQNNPANPAEAMTDILGNDSAAFHMNPDRLGNVVAYVTPTFGGFHAVAAVISEGSSDTDSDALGADDVDATVLAVNWAGAGFGVAAAITNVEGGTTTANVDGSAVTYSASADAFVATTAAAEVADFDIITAGVNYTGIENVYLAASYSKKDTDGTSVEPETIDLAASYTMGKTTLAAIYSVHDTDVSGEDDQEQFLVGVRYALGAKASVGVDYASYNSDAEDAGKNDTLTLEYTLSF